MATLTPATGPASHPQTGRYLAILGAALLAIVGLVALLLIDKQPIFSRAPMSDAALVSDALAAADVANQHGQAMIAFGARLTDYANTPEGQLPEVKAITAQGEHWRVDGQNMIRVAHDVRQALATRPPGPGSIELDRLHGQALMLTSQGQAMTEHATVMHELANTLETQVGQTSNPFVRDNLAEMRRQSNQMAAAGQRLTAAGDSLQSSLSQLERGMGR